MLLGLTLASMQVYAAERGERPLALLDDLDSELDEERASNVCEQVCLAGQTLVTSAHRGWASSLREHGKLYEVDAGRVAHA